LAATSRRIDLVLEVAFHIIPFGDRATLHPNRRIALNLFSLSALNQPLDCAIAILTLEL
jgi:hypothetical protein